ncbi:MAG: S9 family peptidase, partial [Candidatus Aminicenantales bacterium]
KARAKKGEDVIYVYEGPNGQTKKGSWSNLWEFCLKSNKETKLTQEKMIVGDFDISPEGKRVIYTFRRDNRRNTGNLAEIAMLNLADRKITQLTHNKAPERRPSWAPDGQRIAYLAPDDKEWKLAQAKIWIMEVNTQHYSLVSDKFKGIISNFKWTPDGQYIIFNATLRTRSNIFELEIRTGKISQLTNREGSLRFYSLAADGQRAACLFSDYKSPDDIWLVNFSSGQQMKLTDFNPWLKDRMLAEMRIIRWKSKDGLPIEGLLYLPPNYQKGQKVPLILNIHGGPAGVFTNRFRAGFHIYASLGYASLCPNVRGSEGYGDEFLRGNSRDIGGGDYWDLMTGVDKVIATGIADPTKLGLKGWSYGGILGGWTLTKTKRFKAAALGAMVCDWTSEYGMGFNFDVKLWYIGGTPWQNLQGYQNKSSLTYIKNVETPVILFHGEQDTTCSIGQSMNYFTYLYEMGKPVRFLRFPREPHGFREPRHQWVRMAEEIAWMQKYINHLDWKCQRPEEKEEKQAVSQEKGQL